MSPDSFVQQLLLLLPLTPVLTSVVQVGAPQSPFVPQPLFRPSNLSNGHVDRDGGGVSNDRRVLSASYLSNQSNTTVMSVERCSIRLYALNLSNMLIASGDSTNQSALQLDSQWARKSYSIDTRTSIVENQLGSCRDHTWFC